MKRTVGMLVLLTVMAGGSVAAWAAPRADPLISPIKTTSRRDRSTILTAPPALNGKPLRARAVTVTENGVAQRATVVRLPAEQLEVVLVIDASSSMKGAALASAKAAAGDFVGHLPAHARVAVVAFGNTPTLASPLVEDRNAVKIAVQGLQARGATALYDAVRLATMQFSRDAGRRRSIVVLSDGLDTVSSSPLKTATEAIRAAGSHVAIIQLGTSPRNRATLEEVAAAGGGRVASASDPSALAGLYKGIAASLTDQYAVTWRSSSASTAVVAVSLHQDAVVARSEATVDPPGDRKVAASSTAVRSQPVLSQPGPVARWMLLLGVGCLAVALLLLGLIGFAPRRRKARLGSVHPSFKDAGALGGVVSRATASADAALTRHGWRNSLNRRLEQAGIALRPGEYAVISLAAVVLTFALGALTAGPFVGAVLAGVAGTAAHGTVTVMRARRRSQFSDQLGDTLQQMAGSLRAGYGLLQAVDGLGRESLEPTASEFRRIVVEARLGRDLSSSLHAMAERIGTDDFEWVVQAIDIHREVGGDLAEVLDTVAGTIRERNQVMRQVKSLTAEGRLSAYILLALPVLLAAALRLINPTYFVLLTSGAGLVLTGIALVMMAIGALWFRKLCKLEY